jgi:hypothetical protein
MIIKIGSFLIRQHFSILSPPLHPFNHISYHFNFIVHKMIYKIVTYSPILKIWGNIVLELTEGFTKLSAFHAVICVWCFTLFFFVLCTLWCQFLWIVHFWLPLWYFLTLILDKYYQIWYISILGSSEYCYRLVLLHRELSVLRFTHSGYPFDIFKLFLMKEYIYAWDFALICPME